MVADHGLVKRHSADRRRYEFAILCDQVRRNKERFIRRLQGMVAVDGGCITFLGSKRNDGYGRLSFRYKGKHTTIDVQRVFLILQAGATDKDRARRRTRARLPAQALRPARIRAVVAPEWSVGGA